MQDAAAFQAEYRAIVAPYIRDEQAEEFARGVADLIRRAYSTATSYARAQPGGAN